MKKCHDEILTQLFRGKTVEPLSALRASVSTGEQELSLIDVAV